MPLPADEGGVAHATAGRSKQSFALQVVKLVDSAVLPCRSTLGAAGYDISAVRAEIVKAHGQVLVGTGLAMAMPNGTYGRLASRSGLATKYAIHVGAGVVDADYRGEVSVLLINLSSSDWEFKAGDRVAQLILERHASADCVEVEQLEATTRNSAGFGSTGLDRLTSPRPVRRGGGGGEDDCRKDAGAVAG